VRRYFTGFGKEQHLQDLIQRLNSHSLMLGKIAARVEEYYEDGTTTLDAVEAILTEMTRLQTQENDLLNIINHSYSTAIGSNKLADTVAKMVQQLDGQPGPVFAPPSANESEPDLKQAIDRLQCALGDSYDDETHLQVYYDRVMITSFGKLFEVPSRTHDEIQQFIESLNRISEQVIPEKAA